MKTSKLILFAALSVASLISLNLNAQEKLKSTSSMVTFVGADDDHVQAKNTLSVSTLAKNDGELVFTIPIQSFIFPKALMQKHFNQREYLNSAEFPRAKYVGKITNLSVVNFAKDGIYDISINGEMTIKGVSKSITTKAKLTVKSGKINIKSDFSLTLADFGIVFESGMKGKKIPKIVKIGAEFNY